MRPNEFSPDVTRLLIAWRAGDDSALSALTTVLYRELHRLAELYFRRERSDHTLQPTALVHEAYARMAELSHLEWKDRAHFLAITARIMRQILMQYARDRSAQKRGGQNAQITTFDEESIPAAQPSVEFVAIDEGLRALECQDPVHCRILELRYFGGLTTQEIAEVLDLSTATVTRRQKLALAWLFRHMNNNGETGEPGGPTEAGT